MNSEPAYAIGTPGTKWSDGDKVTWLTQQQKKRSYYEQVVTKLDKLSAVFTIEQYGWFCH